MTTTILPATNTERGFRGAIARIENNPAADAAKAWEFASRQIAEMTTASSEGVRNFLDSRHGATSPTMSRASSARARR